MEERVSVIILAKYLVTDKCVENETEKYLWIKLRSWIGQYFVNFGLNLSRKGHLASSMHT